MKTFNNWLIENEYDPYANVPLKTLQDIKKNLESDVKSLLWAEEPGQRGLTHATALSNLRSRRADLAKVEAAIKGRSHDII